MEYNISRLTASLLVDGVPLKTESLPTSVVKGPSDGKDYGISVEFPVALPDKSLLVKDPSFTLSVADVHLTGSSKSVSVVIRVHNSNNVPLSFSSLKLALGGATQDVPISSVAKNSDASASLEYSVPEDVTSVVATLTGTYSASGQKYSVSQSFDLNVPKLSPAPPVAHVSAEYVGLTADGYSVKLSGSVENPNSFPLVLDSLHAVVGSGDVSQDVNLLSNVTILPDANQSFSKTVKLLFVFPKATAKLIAHYNGADHVLATFPVGVEDPNDFLSAPSVSVNVGYDSNATMTFLQ